MRGRILQPETLTEWNALNPRPKRWISATDNWGRRYNEDNPDYFEWQERQRQFRDSLETNSVRQTLAYTRSLRDGFTGSIEDFSRQQNGGSRVLNFGGSQTNYTPLIIGAVAQPHQLLKVCN